MDLHKLYKDIHLLAFYYHWSENEIMSMTIKKRKKYIQLLNEELNETGRAISK